MYFNVSFDAVRLVLVVVFNVLRNENFRKAFTSSQSSLLD